MVAAKEKTPANGTRKGISRRQFLVGTGATVVVGAVGATMLGCKTPAPTATPAPTPAPVKKTLSFTDTGGQTALRQLASTIPPAAGYLVHDSTKCAFCMTCMMACSLSHEGKENLSLSRIQIDSNALGHYPSDLVMNVCRQCTTPVCVQNCPTEACHVDTANGNVRVIDEKKCIGCQTCINSCPQIPHRTIWNQAANKATKCDLCLNTPYWGEKGGPDGKQACVELCPMNAIKLVKQTPSQQGTAGYEVNLRSPNYEGLVTQLNTKVWWG